MKEIIEFRILNDYIHLLPSSVDWKENGSNYIVKVERSSSAFEKIKDLTHLVREKNNDYFFLFHNIIRKYTKKELSEATLFQIKIKSTFEPAGEECGTEYDENTACKICGANRKQIGPLRLQKSSIPKKDIARTIAGEVIVSDNFKKAFESSNLKGIKFEQVYSKDNPIDFIQSVPVSPELSTTVNTIAGIDPFDLSESSEDEVYKCPNGHTIGLNLLSKIYIKDLSQQILEFDFFTTEQKIGVKRGLLRPEPLYLCSQEFRKMVLEKNLKGFGFEIVHVE